MTIHTKISPPVFITLAEYAHSVRHYIETTDDERGYIPRYRWTIDALADRISMKKYQAWKKKKMIKKYNFEMNVDEALAVLEGLQAEKSINVLQQEIIDNLHQLLINKHFSPESLNKKFTQAITIN